MTTVIEFLAEDSDEEIYPTLTYDGSVPIPSIGDHVAHLYKVTERTFNYNPADAPQATVKVSLRGVIELARRASETQMEEFYGNLTPQRLKILSEWVTKEIARSRQKRSRKSVQKP